MPADDFCCVPGCNHKRSQNSPCSTYYTIPEEPSSLRAQWHARIRRDYIEDGKVKNWQATRNHRVCDCHFTQEEKETVLRPKSRFPGRKYVLPSLFPLHSSATTKKRTTTKSTNRVHLPDKKRRKLVFDPPPSSTETASTSSVEPARTSTVEPTSTSNIEPASIVVEELETEDHNLDASMKDGQSGPHGHDYIKTMCDSGSFELLQTNTDLKEFLKISQDNAEIVAEFQHMQNKCQILSLENVKVNNKLFKFYTGFSNYEVFDALYLFLEPKAEDMKYPSGERTILHQHYVVKSNKKPGKKRKTGLREEFFMTLVRLRLGIPSADMALRFGISESSFSSIFTAWVCLLSIELESICKMPPMTGDDYTQAECFSEFDNVRIILDCTELFSETPGALSAHKQFFSSYKHHTTVKFLVGMNSCGAITYISKMFGGRSSDKFITNESEDLLIELNGGEKVMVDRGFTIAEDLPPGVELIMPSFKHRDRSQFPKDELQRNKKISEARVHIERAMRRIKQFIFLAREMKISQKDIYENVFKVCGYLVNFQEPFLKI